MGIYQRQEEVRWHKLDHFDSANSFPTNLKNLPDLPGPVYPTSWRCQICLFSRLYFNYILSDMSNFRRVFYLKKMVEARLELITPGHKPTVLISTAFFITSELDSIK